MTLGFWGLYSITTERTPAARDSSKRSLVRRRAQCAIPCLGFPAPLGDRRCGCVPRSICTPTRDSTETLRPSAAVSGATPLSAQTLERAISTVRLLPLKGRRRTRPE